MEEKYQRENLVRTNSCDVFVASIGKGLTRNRFEICGKLWAAGIKVETDYTENPKPPRQLKRCLRE